MLCIALCEDDKEQLKIVLDLLDEYKKNRDGLELVARAFDDGSALLRDTEALVYDLYLLDILMPGTDGISLARTLRTRDADTPIIFLTSSADYALEAFNVSAFQYLLKPIEREAFFSALDKIIAAYTKNENLFIVIQTTDKTLRIPFADIVCAELSGRNLCFFLRDGTVLTSKTVRVPFAEAVAPLINDSRFLYAHKSFLLNMEWVRELKPRSFVMTNGVEIPVPRNKYTFAKNRYFDYLSARGIGMVNHAR